MSGYARRPFADLFWPKVDQSGGPDACWPFTGYRLPHGYGVQSIGYKADRNVRRTTAHRVAYCLANGIDPLTLSPDVDICHECDNPPCCNPKHLHPGTRTTNMREASDRKRMRGGGWHREQPFCKNGHTLSGPNIAMKNGKRNGCRQCNIEAARAWRERNRDRHLQLLRDGYRRRKSS